MRKDSKKVRPIFVLFFILVVILIELFVIFKNKANSSNKISSALEASDESLQKYADQIIAKCSEKSYRPTCYEEEVPKLMDSPVSISMRDAFRVTFLVQEKDDSYRYCHVLGHKLSAKEVEKDDSKWKEVVTRCPSGVCSNGCIHGGFQQKFRAERLNDDQIVEVLPDLMDICEEKPAWKPTGLEQASCYHALGHLTMYITDAEIKKSIKLCEQIAVKSDGRDLRRLCNDGVFMQIFQPLEPEDFALVEGKVPKKEEIESFCSVYESGMKASCLSESWPLFRDEIKKPEGLVKFCSMEEESERQRCFNALTYVLTSQFNFDLQKISDFCNGLPEMRRGKCFANAASRMIETDYRNIGRSVDLCNLASDSKVRDDCFGELVFYSSYNYHPNSTESLNVCNSLPEPWKTRCFDKTSR